MDMHIGEVNSTVRVTDSQALVSPPVLERIVQAVMARLREQEGSERRRRAETEISNSIAGSRQEES